MNDLFQEAVLISMFAAAVRIATPLLFAALGELITERAGILNLGVEGTLLMAAFAGFAGSFWFGNNFIGVLFAMFVGAVMAFLMVFMAATLKVEQVVTGLSLNLLAAGMSLYLYKTFFQGGEEPYIVVMATQPIPLLSDIPYIGDILFQQKLLTYLAFMAVPAVWFLLYRTKWGLEIRALGENPKVIDTKGMSVSLRQYSAVILGGVLIGLGGAFITIGSVVRFVPDISAGRGWLALVIVIAGNWRPGGILMAALVFAFLDALQLQIQGVGVAMPYQIFLALPYVLAIVLMIFKARRGRSEEPQRLGVPYFRGER
ncbi:ABC transporter permease [Meridianimarinicoccus aquatilis]|uniref:ABC transporter permease n=1 Tax=Meridianimarinicoccus aquatilis TaxID=2552766 RepID=A0A4R6B1A3_9RHOB|nr:ABC transporter permease [Fluviibacterium aquatile]QIE42641.1 ABC transporter permease [Rhodobacteraceae bacterium SC52]TDL88988.1 ABC transporter permease [Fluviibacterium aquatile]